MNFKALIFLVSLYLAKSKLHDVDSIITQVGENNSVGFDDQNVKIRNRLNEDGEIVTETEILKKEHNPFDDFEGIAMGEDFVIINDGNHHKEPQVQVINESEEDERIEDVGLDILSYILA